MDNEPKIRGTRPDLVIIDECGDLPELPDLWEEKSRDSVFTLSKKPRTELMDIALMSAVIAMGGGESKSRQKHFDNLNDRRENGSPPPYVSNKKPSKRRLRRLKGRTKE